MWRAVFALIIKELLAVLKDPKSRMVLIVPPLLQLIVFGYAATFELNRVPIAVYNQDHSQASRDLIARFTGSRIFTQVAALNSARQINPLIDSRKVDLVLAIDRRFTRDLLTHRPAPVQLIVDGRDSNTALIVLGYANSIITSFSLHWLHSHGEPPPPAVLD
ncbi:ABC-2 type transporter, partial [mine drainage metagenome]